VEVYRPMVCHQPRTVAHFKLYRLEAQLFEKAVLYLLRLCAERVVRPRPRKPVRILFYRLGGVLVLKAEELSLQKHSLFHTVFIHYGYQIVGGKTFAELFGYHLKFAAVGVARPAAASAAEFPARSKACYALHYVSVRVDNFHNLLPFLYYLQCGRSIMRPFRKYPHIQSPLTAERTANGPSSRS